MLNMSSIMHKRARPLVTVLAATILSTLLAFQATAIAGDQSVAKVRQVGAFHKWENALALSEDIQKAGKKAFIMEKTLKGKVFYSVLESEQRIDTPTTSPTVKEQGYVQVGAFLSRQNAETSILSLRQQGAITFHCMKKVDGKIYYKVYKKIGVVVSSPCTLETSMVSKPTVTLMPNASSTPPPVASATIKAPSMAGQAPIAQISTDTGSSSGEGFPVTGMINSGKAEAMARPGAESRFIVNTTADDEATGTSLSEQEEASTDMVASAEQALQDDTALESPEETGSAEEFQALPLTGPLPKRPPIAQASGEIVLDISPISPIDDNRHFYIKPEAVVFTDRNQFGTWYARFNEFGGGMVTGQSNKWYVVWFREGATGYVQKADTVEYVLPYENDELYK
jgi:hypothetical protein